MKRGTDSVIVKEGRMADWLGWRVKRGRGGGWGVTDRWDGIE